MRIELLDLAGFDCIGDAVRLSYGSKRASEVIREPLYKLRSAKLFDDDYKLILRLIHKGDSHAKVTRMIQVWMQITAPRYWWSEFDTYRIGVTEMSESTMHTITSRQLNEQDFENGIREENLDYLNSLQAGLHGQDKNKRIYEMKNHLPESFLQTRIVNTNYQVLRHIYFDRRNHILPEWHIFIDFIKQLPFFEFITVEA